MITATSNADSPLTVHATVRGLAIYLDNWAIGELAEGNPSRRQQFIGALHSGYADLMFSVTNAAELSGPKGESSKTVKSFLNEVGHNWFPVELDVFAVMDRERDGADPSKSCISQEFLKAYFQNRTAGVIAGSGRIIDVAEVFCGLGSVLDWVGPERDSIRKGSEIMDATLKTAIEKLMPRYKKDGIAPQPFDKSKRATVTTLNLARILFAESVRLGDHDGLDFCHAVLASAFSSFAALDKKWKLWIERLPIAKNLARIYYRPQLDTMVTDIDAAVTRLRQGIQPVR